MSQLNMDCDTILTYLPNTKAIYEGNQSETKFDSDIRLNPLKEGISRYNRYSPNNQSGIKADLYPGYEFTTIGKSVQDMLIQHIEDVIAVPNECYCIGKLDTLVDPLPYFYHKILNLNQNSRSNLESTQHVPNLEIDPVNSHAWGTDTRFILPRECRMWSSVHPYHQYAKDTSARLTECREIKSLLALSKLPSEGNIEDPSGAGDPKAKVEELSVKYFDNYRTLIDSCVVSRETFEKYKSNFYPNGHAPSSGEVGDLVSLPVSSGIIQVATSPFMQEDRFYFFSSKHLFTWDGPQIISGRVACERKIVIGIWTDYSDTVVLNPNQAGFKLTVQGTTPAPEITSQEQAREQIRKNYEMLASCR